MCGSISSSAILPPHQKSVLIIPQIERIIVRLKIALINLCHFSNLITVFCSRFLITHCPQITKYFKKEFNSTHPQICNRFMSSMIWGKVYSQISHLFKLQCLCRRKKISPQLTSSPVSASLWQFSDVHPLLC